ncbi:toll/interleukin-1 receptor domain-containing protein [Rubritalea tangerina]|uniref:Toll/interleukin-1 receptor domain-containing protein n=1 Tax=Rubritalea tangerina TaxID=430798 RepID=A0ABW4Z6M4_9BACT
MQSSKAGAEKKYWAFISYSSKDKKWGQWLHRNLERYPIPKELQGSILFDGAILGKNLRPIFRDRDELSGSADLGPALENALQQSRYLVVLCSKHSANSTWVNKEIEDFKAMGGEKNILALILDGEPNAGDSEECFPPALRYPTEPLAGDLRKNGDGKERGLLKIVAGAAQLDFDSLYRRHERAQRKKRIVYGALAASIMAALACLSIFALQQRSHAQKNAEAATAAKIEAESNEKRAQKTLVSSYLDRGRQSFVEGSAAESLAFFNEARKITPEVSGIDLMMADSWAQLSPLKAEIGGEMRKISQLAFSAENTSLAIQDLHGGIRRFDLFPVSLTLESHQFNHYKPAPLLFPSTPFLTGFFQQTDPENPSNITREIRKYDWHANTLSGVIPYPKELTEPDLIVASPTGKFVATYTQSYDKQAENIVNIWNQNSSDPLLAQFSIKESPRNFHWFFSADERTLVQLRYSGSVFEVTFRDASTGTHLRSFPLNSRPEAKTVYSNKICIGLHNGEIIEFQRDQEITKRSPATRVISQLGTLQYASDGKQLLAGGAMGNLVLYNTDDFSIAYQIGRQQLDGVIQHVALSKSGRFISVAHKSQVSVFDTSSPERYGLFSWTGSEASITRFSDDDSLLAAGSDNGNIRIWELQQQVSAYRSHKTTGESNLSDPATIEDTQHLVKGNELYQLDLASGSLNKLTSTQGTVTAISPSKKLVQFGGSIPPPSIKNYKSGKILTAPWNSGAVNVFLEPNSPAEGVIFQNNGEVRAYSLAPEFLPNIHRSTLIQGAPFSIVSDDKAPKLCASYEDGQILECQISTEGIANTKLHRLPGSEVTPPTLHELKNHLLLLTLNNQMAIYDLGKKSLTTLPRRGLRSGKLFTSNNELSVLSIDSYGKLETWSSEGELLANTSSPVTRGTELSSLTNPRVAGNTILVDSNTAYTTFGNQLYLWSLPELLLIWRSPALSPFQEELCLRAVVDSQNMVLLTDHPPGYGQSFSTVITVFPPTLVPQIKETENYLSETTGIKFIEGRIIKK